MIGMKPDIAQLQSWIAQSAVTIASLSEQAQTIQAMGQAIVTALKAGRKVMTLGNGGSAAQALHMAEELTGRYKGERPSLPGLCLAADPTLLTCIGNDYGFERLFSRQIQGLGIAGDVLVFFSTSGNGRGLELAMDEAVKKGLATIALLGKGGGPLRGRARHELIIPSQETARIQEAHLLVMHLMLEAVEAEWVKPGGQ